LRFALRSAGSLLSLEGRTFGGWTLHTASGPIWAEREGLRVDAGNPLLNFGPGTASPSPVVTPSPGGKPTTTPSPTPTAT
jgi:hypothetical protein